MGRLWCRDLPVVTAPRAAAPKPITLVYPFYENARFLQTQMEGWSRWPADLRTHVTAILVDDGSPTPLALDVPLPFPVRVFRIEQDVRWNWLAARNIGAHHAADGWLLLTDIDHVVPEDTLRSIVFGTHDPGVVYAFSRREHTGEVVAPHSASFLMTRAMFWTIGGYDEALSGHYGTDGTYRRQVAATASMHVLTDALVRYEYVADSSTTRYQRKQPEDAAVKSIVAARGPHWRPRTRSFPYHEVMVTEGACHSHAQS